MEERQTNKIQIEVNGENERAKKSMVLKKDLTDIVSS